MTAPMMTLQHASQLLASRAVPVQLIGDPQIAIARVHTDTRSICAGDLFVALKGERFDAHDFLAQAKQSGAAAALVERGLEDENWSGLIVPDTRLALGELAAAWRRQFNIPLIAVTGSNGKTTVTQMLAHILEEFAPSQRLATQGNLNNDIGVPLTLLGLRPHHRIAVVELGMNHSGEIARLADLAQPSVALVNNAQREHQEFMQSVQAVAQENGCVISALKHSGVAVFPSDDAYSSLWRAMAGERRQMCFSSGAVAADVTASAQWEQAWWNVRLATPFGAANCRLQISGRHNVKNALAATAAALAAKIDLYTIIAGLEKFKAVKGRSRAIWLAIGAKNYTIIDDTYNANPDSVLAAVDALAELPAPHLLVLGDMGEVGEEGPEYHAEVAEYAMQHGIETLLCVGDLMRYGAAAFPDARHFGGMDALIHAVRAELPHCRSILVKGSRFMRMERVVHALEALAGGTSHDGVSAAQEVTHVA